MYNFTIYQTVPIVSVYQQPSEMYIYLNFIYMDILAYNIIYFVCEQMYDR